VKVVDVELPMIVTSVSSKDSIRGIEVTEMLTFVGTPTNICRSNSWQRRWYDNGLRI
jgi:hypothetical protein